MSKKYTDDSYKSAYERFAKAEKTGVCEECGWKDGDGAVTCFYSNVLGAVTHENAVRAQMTESQRSLYDSYDTGWLIYWDRESELCRQREIAKKNGDDEAWVQSSIEQPAHKHKGPFRYAMDCPPDLLFEPWWMPARLHPREFWPARRRSDSDGVGDQEWISYMVHVYRPHSCGKGHAIDKGPYHFGCSGCGEEIKLWEFGVDYDVG
jgi:hypothetical protein